jgi:hypothetical protein
MRLVTITILRNGRVWIAEKQSRHRDIPARQGRSRCGCGVSALHSSDFSVAAILASILTASGWS